MKLFRIVLVAVISIAFAAYAAYRSWEVAWYEGMIPASLEIERTVMIDGRTGFIEGCGIAVFQLSPTTVDRIRPAGLAGLETARQARDHSDELHTYSQWRETPYAETGDGMTLVDRWLVGRTCAKIDPSLDRSIDTALKSPGSYYATIHEAGLIVIPSLGLAVFSYFG